MRNITLIDVEPKDFTSLANYSDTCMPGVRRFEVSEKCTAILPGAIAALEQRGRG